MRGTRALILALAVAGPSVSTANPGSEAAHISARVKNDGPTAVVRSIYADDRQWKDLLANVATGRRDWLALAVELRPGSDAGATEELTLAVGEALEHRPENVLSIAIDPYPLNEVCDVPETDDPRFDSLPRALETLNKRQVMLRRVTTPSLRTRRDQCTAQLESAKAEISKFYADQVEHDVSASADVLQPNQRSTLNAWLVQYPNLRMATVAECECADDVESMRTGYGGGWPAVPEYGPYVAVGDFNGDGTENFAVALNDTSKSDNAFVLVVFNGPFAGGAKSPAFVRADLDLRHQGLFFGAPRPKPYRLVLGPFESEGDILEPNKTTYRLVTR
jgi:hypothetical protein